MRIAQRGTATITGSGSQQFPVDRIAVYNGTGTVTFVQSSTAPAGFAYSLLATVTATGSYTTAGYTEIVQSIESANVSDFAFGTASASPVTISFWVRSSLSGSYDVSIRNNAANRSNRTTFAVAAGEVNTWVKKSVTFAGDTSGTWTNDTTTAFFVGIHLGHGTNYDNTANTWIANNHPSTLGSIDFAANSGATFYLTGLQVERGSVATPFEHRPIGTELTLCERYFESSFRNGQTVGHNSGNFTIYPSDSLGCGGNSYFNHFYRTRKRSTNPSLRVFDSSAAHPVNENWWRYITACNSGTAVGPNVGVALYADDVCFSGYLQSSGTGIAPIFDWTIEAEL